MKILFSTKTNIKYQRQHETTIDNYVLVFWQTCQNVFLLQFSRFAKLTSLSCYMLSRLSFLIKVPCYPCPSEPSLVFLLCCPLQSFILQKPRTTLFYTCQAIRLYEAWHDAFACKQASSQIHLPFLCAIGTYTNKKEKPCCLLYLVTLYLEWFFRSQSGVFLFVGLQPCRGVGIMQRPIWKCTYRQGYA